MGPLTTHERPPMLIDDVKQQVIQAMRDKDAERRDLLKVVLGELQTVASRTGEAMDDEQAQRIIRKMVKSNQEMAELSDRPGVPEKMKAEIEVLESLLPKTLSTDQIIAALASIADAVKSAGNDGQATGVAMKHLKSSGASVEGKDVGQAVKQMRN
jgi:uncharacterized protein